MKESEAYEIVLMLQAAYGREMPDSTVKLYTAKLTQLDVRPCKRAVDRLIDNSRFLPSVAEIREQTFLIRKDMLDAAAVRERRKALPAPYGDVKALLASVAQSIPEPEQSKRMTADELDQAMAPKQAQGR
jgi:hypothetical protein